MRHIGTTEAIDNAKTVTRIVGRQIVEPELTDGILRGRPSSIRRLDRVVESRVLSNEIVRVKVWTAGGRIVYSDKNRLIGSRYHLGADDLHGPAPRRRRRRDHRSVTTREPVRAPAGQRARGLPWGADPKRTAAPVRDLPALQLDRLERIEHLEGVRAGDHRRASDPRSAPGSARVFDGAPAASRARGARSPPEERPSMRPITSGGELRATFTTAWSRASPAPPSRWPLPRSERGVMGAVRPPARRWSGVPPRLDIASASSAA